MAIRANGVLATLRVGIVRVTHVDLEVSRGAGADQLPLLRLIRRGIAATVVEAQGVARGGAIGKRLAVHRDRRRQDTSARVHERPWSAVVARVKIGGRAGLYEDQVLTRADDLRQPATPKRVSHTARERTHRADGGRGADGGSGEERHSHEQGYDRHPE